MLVLKLPLPCSTGDDELKGISAVPFTLSVVGRTRNKAADGISMSVMFPLTASCGMKNEAADGISVTHTLLASGAIGEAADGISVPFTQPAFDVVRNGVYHGILVALTEPSYDTRRNDVACVVIPVASTQPASGRRRIGFADGISLANILPASESMPVVHGASVVFGTSAAMRHDVSTAAGISQVLTEP